MHKRFYEREKPHLLGTTRGAAQLSTQFIDQRFGVFEVGSVEALGEPVVDLGEHCARLIATALFRKQSRETHRCAQLPRFGILFAPSLDRALKAALSLFSI